MIPQTLLGNIYGKRDLSHYEERITQLEGVFSEKFPTETEKSSVFSVAGRIEVGGNHTDHQLGAVLCASIHLDTLAVASPREDDEIIVYSEGYPPVLLNISETDLVKGEENTTIALIRGVCDQLKKRGYHLKGFQAVLTSDVLSGSGMSSSASFEGIISLILNDFFCNNEVSLVELAKIGQYAENVYFGKPSGLMDQIACLMGGFAYIDFYDPKNPEIELVDSSLLSENYDVCIMDTGDSHGDLTEDYREITEEMAEVAGFFHETHLSRVKEADFFASLPKLKQTVSDRAILRAMHFLQDTKLAKEEYLALKNGDLKKFLQLIRLSGQSSLEKLQNIYSNSQPKTQGASLLLALCQHFLGDEGAFRIHGGGFGGTVQAFVPKNMTSEFQKHIESIMGESSCHIVSIREESARKIR